MGGARGWCLELWQPSSSHLLMEAGSVWMAEWGPETHEDSWWHCYATDVINPGTNCILMCAGEIFKTGKSALLKPPKVANWNVRSQKLNYGTLKRSPTHPQAQFHVARKRVHFRPRGYGEWVIQGEKSPLTDLIFDFLSCKIESKVYLPHWDGEVRRKQILIIADCLIIHEEAVRTETVLQGHQILLCFIFLPAYRKTIISQFPTWIGFNHVTEFWAVGKVTQSPCGLLPSNIPCDLPASSVSYYRHISEAGDQVFILATRWTLNSFIFLKYLISVLKFTTISSHSCFLPSI